MKWLKQVFAKRFNGMDGRIGHVWGDRYWSEIVVGEPPAEEGATGVRPLYEEEDPGVRPLYGDAAETTRFLLFFLPNQPQSPQYAAPPPPRNIEETRQKEPISGS
jgi:hypothetical protein